MADKRSGPSWITVLITFAAAAGLAGAGFYFYLQGGEPTPDAGDGSPREEASSVSGQEATKEMELYFASPDGARLVPEKRQVPLKEDIVSRCRAIIDELKKGPHGESVPCLPVELAPRALFPSGNAMVIDLQPKIREASAGAMQEMLIWYSLVNSIIMNVQDIGAVQFLVDGAEADVIFGHMDMKGPITDRLDLVVRP